MAQILDGITCITCNGKIAVTSVYDKEINRLIVNRAMCIDCFNTVVVPNEDWNKFVSENCYEDKNIQI